MYIYRHIYMYFASNFVYIYILYTTNSAHIILIMTLCIYRY